MVVDVLVILICFGICVSLVRSTYRKFNSKLGLQLAMVLGVHLLVTLAYYYLTTTDTGNDSMRFWITSRRATPEEAWQYFISGRSTYFIFSLLYPLSNLLNLTYFSCTIIFSTIGFVAIRIFFHLTYQEIPYNSKIWGIKLFPTLFFLPNLHYWSVGVGKDTLILLAVALFVYSLKALRSRFWSLIFSFLIFLLVRAHVLLMIVIGFGIAVFFVRKINWVYKMGIAIIFVAGTILVLPKAMEMAGMDSLSVDDYNEFAANRVDKLSQSHTRSSVDVGSYPLPLKMFTFLYRPTFIDIIGVPALIAAFENLLLLLVTIKAFSRKAKSSFKAAPLLLKGMLFYSIISTLLFSMSLGNLGIMLRMRNMILPCLIIYLLWNLSYLQIHKIKKYEKTI